ncbi:MAG: HEPN domain-containing protein [Armatimonadota bacterium]
MHPLHGAIAWGHSVMDLIEKLGETVGAIDADLLDATRRLDRYYVAPRYPDAHPAGPSHRYYTEPDARQTVADAERVVSWCDTHFSH